ncbi:acetylornithine carbamoyltransferase [Robiginitalea aurantiaca]|uniref:N-succinylornithine carbamoyltransferase n=1 Tax=Robiginitalea aurantiaca TaxID=3056915 RepID=A0ABT7WET7_9FLAO|nr:acetylornithine carbamoyltransferase [Robiginitalea aurantiaca]MDM9631435.1 acetylornithine carbamoyltransferase [Robiginitalea aurantiaca]
MKHFLSTEDIGSLPEWIAKGKELTENPKDLRSLGNGKTLCLLFFNNSLRTRLSTQKAAHLLGLEVIVMNFGSEGWNLELTDGTVMEHGAAEHIREAAAVVGVYADLIGVRAFAGLKDRETDKAEGILNGFAAHSGIPVINMESATGHPLQALADALTISGATKKNRPKVVLSWAPHPKALPQAVPNSFVKIMRRMPVDLVVTHPPGYELDVDITGAYTPVYDQRQALEEADFVYVKNWSSVTRYGEVLLRDSTWMMTSEKLGKAQFMHCLPVRRNVVVADEVLDGHQSLVLRQAANRTVAAQLAMMHVLGKS